MLDFRFTYSDGNFYEVKGVKKIIISTPSSTREVPGDEILATLLPLKTMYLYTTDGNITVSGTNLMVIDVVRQDS